MLQLHPAFAGLGLGWSKIGIRAGQGHEGLCVCGGGQGAWVNKNRLTSHWWVCGGSGYPAFRGKALQDDKR